MFTHKHYPTSQSIQPVARERIPAVPSLSPHNLDDGIVVVAASRVDRDTCRLVDDDHVGVFVDDADGKGGDGGFMSVHGVGYDIAVADGGVGGDGFAIEDYVTGFDGVFLGKESLIKSCNSEC